MLRDLALADIEVATRVVIFPQDLAAEYFSDVGRHAASAGAITSDELGEWLDGIAGLKAGPRAVRDGWVFPVHRSRLRRLSPRASALP